MKPQATWRCRLVDAWTQQESVQQMVDSIMLHPLQRFGFLNTFVLAPVIWNGSRNVFVFHWSMPGRIKNRSCGFNRSKSKLRDYDLISGFQFWESYQKDFFNGQSQAIFLQADEFPKCWTIYNNFIDTEKLLSLITDDLLDRSIKIANTF